MRDCGHLASMERPTEFNAVLSDFVRSTMKTHVA
jgi:pimeloyl-ACP methyl ester carboxylesterase